MRLRTTLLSLLLPLSFGAAAAQEAGDDVENEARLPIRRVVLYKHGIGYFERQGAVEGDATALLRFEQEQMSDVLKTLTVLDLGGGSIAAIAYDSQKPASKVLEEFPFDLRQDEVQQAILRQMRGAVITANVAGIGEVTGAVLGLDHRVEIVDGTTVKVPRVSVLTDAGEIVGADLFDLRSLRFEDEELTADVQRFLKVLRGTLHRDDKAMEIRCRGVGERQIFAAYAVEQPVWKATYRLVLDEEEAPLLQGWAVVDNASDEDWSDVTLSLVAGLPVSFRQDLYTPRYVERPVVEPQETASVGLTGELRRGEDAEVADRRARFSALEKLSELGYVGGKKAEASAAAADALRQQQAQAVAREVGDLLEYVIDHPVTIPRNRSALLPIVASEVEGQKVSLYNQDVRAPNPMWSVRMINGTGLTLEGGPVTVLEEETYAGESMIGTVKPGERLYVPYAVDLGVKATTELDTKSERVHRVVITRGTMVARFQLVERKTYTFDNKDDEGRTVVVEHPRRGNYELRTPAKADEQELDLLRFFLEVPANTEKALTVVETEERSQSWALTNLDQSQLTFFLQQGMLNEDAEATLRRIVAMRGEIQDLQRRIEQRNTSLKEIEQDQARVRKNLEALGDSAEEKDLRRAYVEQLAQDEEEVRRLKSEIEELRSELEAKRRDLDALVTDVALDYTLSG